MFGTRHRRKERLKSTSSNCSNGPAYEEQFEDLNIANQVATNGEIRNISGRKNSAAERTTGGNERNSYFTVIVFLCGVIFALFAIALSDAYIRSGGFKPFSSTESIPSGLLPDIQHLDLVDEDDPVVAMSKTNYVTKEGANDFVTSFVDGDDAEALKSLGAALQLKRRNHLDKARKVFLHAMALSPKNPKILNRYGEFLEEVDHDIVEADHLYTKALLFSDSGSEEHIRALVNRRRTAAMVDEIDGESLKTIDSKKKALQKIGNHNASFKKAKKEAYYQHIHHTVGIEGNTMSLAHTRSILETKLAVGGKSIIEHNEVLGLDAALKYINQTLVDRVTGDIRLQDILEIHKRVIGYTDPVEAGMFRRTQVFVGDHIPPNADHIQQLMERFMNWLHSSEVLHMHPVKLAALAHYKLVYIHPFVDGNGRTSRLLMNLILMQHGFPPVIIRKQDRLQYYQHLVTANSGDVRPFVRFIAMSTERTLDAYLAASSEHSLVPFTTDDVTIPKGDAADLLEYHEKVIMGGVVGPLSTNQSESDQEEST